MRYALLGVAGLVLAAFVGVAYVWPWVQRTDSKAAAQALIAGAKLAERQIAASAEKAGSLVSAGQGVKLSPKKDPKFGELKWVVEGNGAIRGWNAKNTIEIAISPVFSDGRVSWHCRGFPNEAMPASCGGR